MIATFSGVVHQPLQTGLLLFVAFHWKSRGQFFDFRSRLVCIGLGSWAALLASRRRPLTSKQKSNRRELRKRRLRKVVTPQPNSMLRPGGRDDPDVTTP